MPHINLKLDEIPIGEPLRVEHAGTALVVVRTEHAVVAFPDVCPHAHWRLSDGEVINGNLECPGHGWEFDLATGGCHTVPAYPLQPLPVTVRGNQVRIAWDESITESTSCLSRVRKR